MKIALRGEPGICAALEAGLRAQGCRPAGEDLPDLMVWCAPLAPAQDVSHALAGEVTGPWRHYADRCGPPAGDNSGEKRARGALLLLCGAEGGGESRLLAGLLPGLALRFAPNLRVNLLAGSYAEPEGFLRPAFFWLARSPVVTGQILGSKPR
ncbi:Rossmann fold domain-containing protein [Falsigemmobacter faecalis]|uniref:Short chain dehydrogenase-like proteobacteria domain-containing protein n=1 Tax=Falsigemmobacter faecalis TaxID=2488730 RepID=A0A3P3DI29_9RHOB|nr:hypothetical protein [Falsigemmobacter faecalis]RRH73900.1 hypothetical protein EG244_11450 [Falsigemmobacter faecalis]